MAPGKRGRQVRPTRRHASERSHRASRRAICKRSKIWWVTNMVYKHRKPTADLRRVLVPEKRDACLLATAERLEGHRAFPATAARRKTCRQTARANWISSQARARGNYRDRPETTGVPGTTCGHARERVRGVGMHLAYSRQTSKNRFFNRTSRARRATGGTRGRRHVVSA